MNRLAVEQASQNRIGYVHLRAMGAPNMAEWTREYYPVFNRPGLIVDVRDNRGGNIDAWVARLDPRAVVVDLERDEAVRHTRRSYLRSTRKVSHRCLTGACAAAGYPSAP